MLNLVVAILFLANATIIATLNVTEAILLTTIVGGVIQHRRRVGEHINTPLAGGVKF
jgi:hypothetical protein